MASALTTFPLLAPGADVDFGGLDRLVVAAMNELVGDEAEPALDREVARITAGERSKPRRTV